MKRKPLFLDRDGVLNVRVTGYVSSVEDLELFPWTVEALRKLNDCGFDLFVISNQQGVAKGVTSPENLERITEAIQQSCRQHGFKIRKFYYATTLKSENHPWRKPNPGMIFAARDEFSLDLTGSYMIGDNPSDIECGARAGCNTILVLSGMSGPANLSSWNYPPGQVFPTLLEAAEWLCQP